MSATTTSVAPKVYQRLYDKSKANAGSLCQVWVGLDPSGDTFQNALFLGVDDPLITQLGDDAQGQQQFATFGGSSFNSGRDDEGEIACTAVGWLGDHGSSAALTAIANAYAIKAMVETFVRTDPTLGLQADGTCAFVITQVTRSRHRLLHDSNGTSCAVFFTITYKARI